MYKYAHYYYGVTLPEYLGKRKFTFMAATENIFIIQETFSDGSFTKKNIKIVDDPEYVYKIQKTHIKARGAAAGLYDYIVNCFENDFCASIATNILINAFDNVKEMKI